MWVIINNERVNLDKVVNYHQGTDMNKDILYIKYEGINGNDIFEFKNEEECEKFIDKLDSIIRKSYSIYSIVGESVEVQ